MRTLLSALAFTLFATTLHAACEGPDAFLQLPNSTQTDLRARAAQVPYNTGTLWQVEKDGVTSTLVGTLHISHPKHADTIDTLLAMDVAASQVLLELTTPAQSAFQRHLVENPDVFLIEQGDSLIDRLGDAHWATLSSELQSRGIPPFMAARYQPWFLGLTLAMPPCAMAEIAAGSKGLDHMIEQMAHDLDLPTDSLDSTEGLLAILASDPLDVQVKEMIWSLELDLFEDTTTQFPAMIALYEQEEIQLIWDLGRHMALARAKDDATARDLAALLAEVQAELIEKRNRQWADRLIPELVTTASIVAVGALHMPGEAGLLRLLETAGYTVSRLPLR
ncbi:TraB family protein [Shimia sp. SK013]|uniref:TraB/GumN family protein n=1 Tax=Shimia sp. SK013 TaxID=1389006 RepID=UPI0006B55490|nr:TraB/GumN family protein [Shimia sp. SK013]KPA20960.1 TraB family protein [Shimia sp. SK013]